MGSNLIGATNLVPMAMVFLVTGYKTDPGNEVVKPPGFSRCLLETINSLNCPDKCENHFSPSSKDFSACNSTSVYKMRRGSQG